MGQKRMLAHTWEFLGCQIQSWFGASARITLQICKHFWCLAVSGGSGIVFPKTYLVGKNLLRSLLVRVQVLHPSSSVRRGVSIGILAAADRVEFLKYPTDLNRRITLKMLMAQDTVLQQYPIVITVCNCLTVPHE